MSTIQWVPDKEKAKQFKEQVIETLKDIMALYSVEKSQQLSEEAKRTNQNFCKKVNECIQAIDGELKSWNKKTIHERHTSCDFLLLMRCPIETLAKSPEAAQHKGLFAELLQMLCGFRTNRQKALMAIEDTLFRQPQTICAVGPRGTTYWENAQRSMIV